MRFWPKRIGPNEIGQSEIGPSGAHIQMLNLAGVGQCTTFLSLSRAVAQSARFNQVKLDGLA